MNDIKEVYTKFFQGKIKEEMSTLILQGDWTSNERIDVIKRVKNISDTDELLAYYKKDFDETIVCYKKTIKE